MDQITPLKYIDFDEESLASPYIYNGITFMLTYYPKRIIDMYMKNKFDVLIDLISLGFKNATPVKIKDINYIYYKVTINVGEIIIIVDYNSDDKRNMEIEVVYAPGKISWQNVNTENVIRDILHEFPELKPMVKFPPQIIPE